MQQARFTPFAEDTWVGVEVILRDCALHLQQVVYSCAGSSIQMTPCEMRYALESAIASIARWTIRCTLF